jgi:hypothetical protein
MSIFDVPDQQLDPPEYKEPIDFDTLGDYQHDIQRQYELDHEWRDDR